MKRSHTISKIDKKGGRSRRKEETTKQKRISNSKPKTLKQQTNTSQKRDGRPLWRGFMCKPYVKRFKRHLFTSSLPTSSKGKRTQKEPLNSKQFKY